MRTIFMTCVFLLSLTTGFAQDESQNKLFEELRSTSWVGSFHFEVFRKTLGGNKKLTRVSDEYAINVQFTDAQTEDGKISYYFSKDVTKAKGADKFVFNHIDVQACEGEPRELEVLSENGDGSYAGTVYAPECKKGKRTIKTLNVQSIERDGDNLSIILADKAIGEYVTFKVIYKFKQIEE